MEKSEFSNNFIQIIKGSAISIILTLILLLIFSIILTYTNIQENIISPVIIVISTISLLVGSSISTLKIKKNGLINGMLVGIIYILSIYILSSITGSGFTVSVTTLIMIICSIIGGILGGIIGVNLN